jgi:hypothetical protein
VILHHNCLENQRVAISNRVLGITPQCTPVGRTILTRAAQFLARHLPKTTQEELGLFAYAYSGAKRTRYLDATDRVIANGLTRKDSTISMFIKPDRMNPLEKVKPDPRPIQFRDSRYCVVLASYLKPIEPHLYSLKIPSISPTRLVGKGCNQLRRARICHSKWTRFATPVAISIDASRFDKHVNTALLQAEHLVYQLCNPDPDFARILRWQLRNTCRSSLGLVYRTRGKRMSGDMNTALGNCIIMLIMVIAVLQPLNVSYDLFDDGDDCLVFCDLRHLTLVQGAIQTMAQFGMVIRVDSVAHQFENISWCQSQPVLTYHGWKFVRNPYKVLSHTLCSMKWYHLNETGRLTFLRGLATCEAILNKGVPVLQPFAEALLRVAGKGKVAFDVSSGEYFRYLRELQAVPLVDEFVPITTEARLSFSQAFGMDVSTQMALEHDLAHWAFSVSGLAHDTPVCSYFDWSDQRSWFDGRQGF